MSHSMLVAALALAAATLISCGPQTPPAASTAVSSAAIQAVKEAGEARTSAIQAGDIDKYLEFYLDDAVWVPPHAPEIVGKEVARARMKPMLEQVAIEQTLSPAEHLITGPDWVAERGHYAMTVGARKGGEVRDDGGNYIVLWNRAADGKWKVAWEMWTSASSMLEPPAKK